MVNKSDIEAVERVLLNEEKSATEISTMKENIWFFFMKTARRRVPCPAVVLARLNAVIDVCKDIGDAKTGQVLLFPAALQLLILYDSTLLRNASAIPLGSHCTSDGARRRLGSRDTIASVAPAALKQESPISSNPFRQLLCILSAAPLRVDRIQLSVEVQKDRREPWNGGGDRKLHLPMHDRPDSAFDCILVQYLEYSGWLAPLDFEDDGERAGLADSVLTFDGKPTGAAGEG